MNQGEVEEGEVVSSDEEDLGQKPRSNKGNSVAEADPNASGKSVKRSASLPNASDVPPSKEVKLIEEDVSDEGEIFSDDEEAAYYPRIVKSRDSTKTHSSGKSAKANTEDESSGNSSSGTFDHDSGSRDYGSENQDLLDQDRSSRHTSEGSKYSPSARDSRGKRRGRWSKEQGSWTEGSNGHRSKGTPYRQHKHDGRTGSVHNISARYMSSYQITCVAAAVKDRRDRGEALLVTPKGNGCNNLDQFNYPAPPSWYLEALEAYEEKEKEKEKEKDQKDKSKVAANEDEGSSEVATTDTSLDRPELLVIDDAELKVDTEPQGTMQASDEPKANQVEEGAHSPKDVVPSIGGNADESDDDYDRYLDQLDEEEEEIEDQPPDIGSVVTSLNEEFPQLNPAPEQTQTLSKLVGVFQQEESLQQLLRQNIGDDEVQTNAQPSKQGKKKGKGADGKVKKEKEKADLLKSKPCRFFRNGVCKNGANCTYSHNVEREKKKEICKFYLQDSCTKGDDCLYYHGTFPCKFHHTNNGCYQGDKCRFSHEPLTSETYELLLTVLDPNSRDPTKLPQLPAGIDTEKQQDSALTVSNTTRGITSDVEASTSTVVRKPSSLKRQWWESAGEVTVNEPTVQQKGSSGCLVVSIPLSALRKGQSKVGDWKDTPKGTKATTPASNDLKGPIPLFPPGSLPLARSSTYQLPLHPEAVVGEGGETRIPSRALLPTPPAHMQLSPEELRKMEEMEPIVWVAPRIPQSSGPEENGLNAKGYQSPSQHPPLEGAPGRNGDLGDHNGTFTQVNGAFEPRLPWPPRDPRVSHTTSQESGLDQGRDRKSVV